jgi:hypothetical protein
MRDVNVEEGCWSPRRSRKRGSWSWRETRTCPGWAHSEHVLAEVEEFVTGVRAQQTTNLARTFDDRLPDIVGSTETATQVGDVRWREMLERHHAVVPVRP